MVVNFREEQIFMDFVQFLINTCMVFKKYNICSAWILDTVISTYQLIIKYAST